MDTTYPTITTDLRQGLACGRAGGRGVSAQVLVALDFAGDTDARPLAAAIGDALVSWDETTVPHWRTGEPVVCHRITFDSGMLRNTEAHGMGFRHGFSVHVEQGAL